MSLRKLCWCFSARSLKCCKDTVFGGKFIHLLKGLSCRTDSARIFPIWRQKVAHRKTHRKVYRKTHRKTECFHRIFPPNFFPNFQCVCFCAVRTVHATEKRSPKKFSQKIHRGTEQKSRVPMWQGWKPLNMPFREAKIIPKN